MSSVVAMQGTFCTDTLALACQAEELQRLFGVDRTAKELPHNGDRIATLLN
jgi:hypothetical protein